MIKVKSLISASIIAISLIGVQGCGKRVSKNTALLPSESNLEKWGQMLDAQEAPNDMQLLTTPKPSVMSPNIAITKMLQSLNSYDNKSDFSYNTTYTINRVNEVVIRGVKHYVGLCEFDHKKSNGSDILELQGVSPCISIVNAENIDNQAILRTANAKGEPYKLLLHLESHLNGRDDENHIRKYLHNNGFTNYRTLSYEISKPNIELDDDFNVYYSASWLYDDAIGEIGTAYYPIAFTLTNLQTREIKSYAMDNPMTKDVDEGAFLSENIMYTFDQIPSWVDWVYSKRLFVQMATHAGFPVENYGKKAFKRWQILDGTLVSDDIEVCEYSSSCSGGNVVVDSSKSRDGRDIILTAFYTSRSNDLSVNSILQFNARTGRTVKFDRTGSLKGMTVKSAVIELMENSNLMIGHYDVEDLTLNPIFGTHTWQGIITRNLHDNEGYDTTQTGDSSTFYSEKDISYSVYAKTCLMEATNDIKISDIICHANPETAYIMYRDHIYKKTGGTQLSTALQDKEISGVISKRYQFNGQIIFKLQGVKKDFIVTIEDVFDKSLGDAVSMDVGDEVYFKYGDQVNMKKVPVRLAKYKI